MKNLRVNGGLTNHTLHSNRKLDIIGNEVLPLNAKADDFYIIVEHQLFLCYYIGESKTFINFKFKNF